jgi:hypothetical protein
MNYRSLDREATIDLNLQAKYIAFIAYRPNSNSLLGALNHRGTRRARIRNS